MKAQIAMKSMAVFQGKYITVFHNIPALTSDQWRRQKQELEQQLFDIFVKYQK
jgi:hypothetical protein